MAKKKLKARGNFRKVTPAVAERYIAYWKKRKVETAGQIPDGKDAAVQKIRLMEALSVWRAFGRKMAEYEKAKAEYDTKLAEFKALGAKKVFENAGLPAKYLKPKAPAKPSKTDARSVRGGNFKKVSKKQALTYLRTMFTRAAKNAVYGPAARVTLTKLSDSKTGRSKDAIKTRETFSPRMQEAFLLVGPEQATGMWVKANTLQTKLAEQKAIKDKKAEERKATVNAAKVAAHQKKIEAAEKRLAKLREAGVGIVAARRARRARRGRRLLRRRAR